MNNVLSDFYKASGLKVNYDKVMSYVIDPRFVSRRKKARISQLSSTSVANSLGKYLGFPLI